MNPKPKTHGNICFWGLVFSILFLYSYEIAYSVTLRPILGSSENRYDMRFPIGTYYNLVWNVRQTLVFLSNPSYTISEVVFPPDAYFADVIYFPFLAGVQWFIYGCIFGWLKSRINFKRHKTEG